MSHPARFSRRTFVKSIAYAGAAMPLMSPNLVRAVSANSRLNIAGVGVGGKGSSDLAETSAIAMTKGMTADQAYARRLNNVVGLCDVDENTLAGAKNRYVDAQTFTDWRVMFDKIAKEIDAVTISTPDHMHAAVTMTAMQLGKHVYTQKPLTHDVYEARQLALYAKAHPTIVTQMGNQGHSSVGYRMLVQMIQQGVIGKVREAHAWSDRPIWPQGMEKPEGSDPVPAHLHWDLWLGTAPERPFAGARDPQKKGRGWYHPFNWRGILDFGTGAQGDMACHIMDPVVWSMDLGAPAAVWSDAPTPTADSYPKWSVIHYSFPGTPYTAPTVQVTWYDGGKMPSQDLIPDKTIDLARNKNGSLYIGDKGVLFCNHDSGPQLLPREEFADVQRPTFEPKNHYQTWANACKGDGVTNSHFAYAAALTETVLLGNIALRFPGEKLSWNAADLRFTNNDKANRYVRREYRKGWEVRGL